LQITFQIIYLRQRIRQEQSSGEGIADDKISITGNTIVDSVYQNLEIARKKVRALEASGLTSRVVLPGHGTQGGERG
jgi:UDP-N-acetylglucosamine 2-epimerase